MFLFPKSLSTKNSPQRRSPQWEDICSHLEHPCSSLCSRDEKYPAHAAWRNALSTGQRKGSVQHSPSPGAPAKTELCWCRGPVPGGDSRHRTPSRHLSLKSFFPSFRDNHSTLPINHLMTAFIQDRGSKNQCPYSSSSESWLCQSSLLLFVELVTAALWTITLW